MVFVAKKTGTALKEYMVQPAFNQAAVKHHRSYQELTKEGLDAIRQPVKDVIARLGGAVVHDGSGYGVKGDPFENAAHMLVKVTQDTAQEIEKVQGVGAVVDASGVAYALSAEKRNWIVDTDVSEDKAAYDALREKVREIVVKDGGEMIRDGSGYKVPGHPDSHSAVLLVKASETAARAIEKLEGVGLVEENLRHVIARPGVRPPANRP